MTGMRIGIDVGGTFTDLVAVDGAGRTTVAKAATTPQDQSIGVLDGLTELAARMGTTLAGLMAATGQIVHGTTVATNALLERRGALTGLLTTEGHRDVLEMREGLKPDRYDLRKPPPEPLVPRNLRLGVRERVRHDGSVATPLDPASLDAAIDRLRDHGVEAVAVCFLHAWKNADHERRVRARLAERMPGVYVSLSSEVLPQIKEYERVSTTVVNAYVGLTVERYLTRLEARLSEAGFCGALYILLSHGGIAPVAEAARLAAATVLSGPAGGVAGARLCAALTGAADLIPFDMGGTSSDMSVIADGEATLTPQGALAGERIALRSLDIASIGAGGGSVARVDGGGALQVGPESAGAVPGPASYGQGGTRPTVTDANLVLGYLDPARFLGGRRTLDVAAAEAAMDGLAADLGVDRIAAAAGIHRLVNLKMANGIRLVTVRRGLDPRRFALLAFGGAAGLHAVEVARQLDVARVIVPDVASVLSAWGMLAGNLSYEAAQSHVGDAAALDPARLRAIMEGLRTEAEARLAASFSGASRTLFSADMRYGEQVFEVEVPLDGIDFQAPDAVLEIVERFHRRHEELYTYASPGQEVVLVNARATAVGEVPAIRDAPDRARPADAPAEPLRHRRVFLDGWHEAPVFAFERLAAGQGIAGPAVVEAETTTILLGPADRLEADRRGWLHITVGAP